MYIIIFLSSMLLSSLLINSFIDMYGKIIAIKKAKQFDEISRKLDKKLASYERDDV